MLSAFYIMNAKGDVLISRLYRSDIKRNSSDQFRIQVLSNPNIRSPVTTISNISYLHIRNEELFLVAALRQNANLAIVFEFLYKVVRLGESYFGRLGEAEVRNNFVLIYELLDEICDFGYPQTTESQTLKQFITTESVRNDRSVRSDPQQISIQATGAVPWRRPDIKYRKNEAFVDVVEQVNILISSVGTVLRSDVTGSVVMRAYLSGMPECKIALNDAIGPESHSSEQMGSNGGSSSSSNKVVLDDCQFHQCVNLSDYEKNRSVQFVPPDGECELIKYRAMSNIQQPFRVTPVVTSNGSTIVSYSIHLRALFDSKLSAQAIVIKIPVPPNTRKVKNLSVSGFGSITAGGGVGGKAKHAATENCIVWKIPKMQGGSDLTLTADADLVPNVREKTWNRPPISMDFRVLMYTASGLSVRYLKIFERSGYHTVKWVRYLTKAGNYQIKF